MTDDMQRQFASPCVIFLGDESTASFAKTGIGLRDWRPERCLGQIRLTDQAIDLELPDLDIAGAAEKGAKVLIIGVANIGGGIPDHWMGTLIEAAEAGLDIIAGMHERLGSSPALAEAARKSGAALIDVRVPPANIPIATGRKRPGKRLLTVGTDCAVGKKYTALALAREMTARGMDSDFRATGQTGIMIEGHGIPIDAVVCDFTAGAAEMLTPGNDPQHWDIIEGQGALTHPAYAGVTLGLLHGSQPDAFVLCHEAGRTETKGWPDYPLLPLADCIAMTIEMGKRTNPGIRCAGLSINTSSLDDDARKDLLAHIGEELGLPAVDPVKTGVGALIDHLATF